MIETGILIVIAAAAVWYLLRRFKATLKAENPSCGCGGCGNCPALPEKERKAPETKVKQP